ncbi:MAG: phospho-N-acetylmuramoyl-pentapeptide-transferase [Candidatus Brocadiaceae bacterium]|nr:phospho-N-acetylmuramoyl-pentapeptide-transferase [Candidatus Brocadiaceae bacterium]
MLARLLSEYSRAGGPGVRAAAAALTALLICLAAGQPVIAWLRARKLGEKTEKTPIDDPALRARIAAKSGTPTMGGVLILGALVVSCALWADLAETGVLVALGTALALAVLGAVDDLQKLHGTGRGLSSLRKLSWQILIGLGAGLALAGHVRGTAAAGALLSPPWALLGRAAVPALAVWGAVFVAGMSNATNVTDGMDGLLSGLAALASTALAAGCLIAHRAGMAQAAEPAVFCAAMAGACAGFLCHNRHPARVFMGDTGALAIGGGLAAAAVAARLEALLLVVGAVFVIELTSSGLQIASIRLLHRRVLPIAPVHHVFQRRGAAEPRIVLGFHLCGLAAALAGLGLLWF